jgi:outer membrane receptor for monomeric catechols
MSLYTTYIIYVHVYSLYYLCHTTYIFYVSVVTLTHKSFSMTSQGSGEQKCGGFEVGGVGFVCNVWLLFYGYPLVSATVRYVVESKFNYKICRYMKTYFSLYDFSL